MVSARFQKVWVEPGYVGERKGGGGARREVDMWGTDFKRNKAGGKNGGGSGVDAAKEAEKRRAEDMVAGGAMEIYTDGSGQEAGAGWGWVAVVLRQEQRARRGPVVTDKAQVGWRGAEKATTAQLVRIPAPQVWLPQRTLSVSMVSASELRVCLQNQYGPPARTSSSSTGLRPVPPVRTDPVRIKYSP